MAADRLCGMEVEYGFAVRSRGVKKVPKAAMLGALMAEAESHLTALQGCRDGGLFLANGGRLYLDTGNHVEWCTPETPEPDEVVRYIKAGDRMLVELARRVEVKHPDVELKIFRCNVDYARGRSTWGHHESYMHRIQSARLNAQLLPHLVTRIIYCGSGGLNPRSRGIEFSLSPRSAHLNNTVSGDSTSDRGILHTRNEPLCGNHWRRLHLICGDGLCSPAALWLQVATTTLVVALIEHGLAPTGVQFRHPVQALHAFARDTRLVARQRLVGGHFGTALEIQRAYLAAAEAAAQHPLMPAWTPEACARWRKTLAALERSPDDPAGGLDWRLKRVLHRAVCRKSEISKVERMFWNRLLGARGMELMQLAVPDGRGMLRSGLFENAALLAARAGLDSEFPEVAAAGRCWEGLARFLRLRARLCELELRWGEIGGQGIYEKLAASGNLPAESAEPAGVAEALETPPQRCRAHLRGTVIGRLAREHKGVAYAGWDMVLDVDNERQLDLTDPFVSREVWLSTEASESAATAIERSVVRRRLMRLRGRFRAEF